MLAYISYRNLLQILANPEAQKIYVLNGHTGSPIYLWWYYEYTHDYRVLTVFAEGINWLINNIDRYDTGNGSYFDLNGHLARDNYHKVQVTQLEILRNY